MNQQHRFDLKKFTVTPGQFTSLATFDPNYTGQLEGKKQSETTLKEDIKDLSNAQELLWATKQFSILIVLQAMDAAGKDGTIKHVMSGINPQGCDVHSFKAPTEEERLHHFLWRPTRYLPQRGKITIFNRSYYEEVLVVRVHPEILNKEWLPVSMRNAPLDAIWQSRYDEINEWEKQQVKNGIVVIKCFLNVSKGVQTERFISRLQNKDKQWKFSPSDFEERKYWDQYQEAYEKMLNATSTPDAPWYVIPANNKWYTHAVVADIITNRIESLGLKLPDISQKEKDRLEQIREQFESEIKSQKVKK